MGSMPQTVLSETHHAELRSEDSSVVVRAAWSRSEDLVSPDKFGRNFLNFTIESVLSNHVFEANRGVSNFHSVASSPDGSSQATEPVIIGMPSEALAFVWQAAVSKSTQAASMKFLLPAEDGYIVRSDFVEESLRACPFASEVKGFVTPGQHCTPSRASVSEGPASMLLALLQSSAGVVVATGGSKTLQALDEEFEDRLSWPWTVPMPIERRRIVMVGEKRSWGTAPMFYKTAKACGISVVIMDTPGHRMEDPNGQGALFREHFVPFSGFKLENLGERIVEVIRGLPYRVDGITTTRDTFLPGIARACQILGLRSITPEAYLRATNKYETRLLSPAPTSMKVDSLESFLPRLKAMTEPLQYPLIVKPVRCHGSEGVRRVGDETELIDALRFAFTSLEQQHSNVGLQVLDAPVIIETYCEGPEIDVNLVLWDGEVLFSEVTDNFPCSGDSPAGLKVEKDQFGATGSVFPSGLPQAEVDMLQRDVLDIVRKLGLSSGVIHAEAKVHNSALEYYTDENGVEDLRPRKGAKAGAATSFLLEVNPRAPGTPDLAGSAYTNGVDYYTLTLMDAIGDEARFRSLARGFRRKPLYHHGYTPLLLKTRTSGRMPAELGLEKLGLAEHYADHWQWWKSGEVVPVAEKRPYPGLGYIVFRSRNSRRELIETIAHARQNLRVDLE